MRRIKDRSIPTQCRRYERAGVSLALGALASLELLESTCLDILSTPCIVRQAENGRA
jgi:hypothetical protein